MTTHEEIFDRVRKILREDFDLAESEIQRSSHLIDDLDLDSIDSIELAVRLESVAGLRIEEEQLKGLRTVGDIVDLVHRYLGREEGGGA